MSSVKDVGLERTTRGEGKRDVSIGIFNWTEICHSSYN